MAKKKKLTKGERKEAHLRKGKQWLLTYTGLPKKMNKHYRERFHVDAVTAVKDLQELEVNYTQEQLDQIKQAEEQRLRQRRMEWKRENGNGWQSCMRTAMVVLLLLLDIQMAAHRMVRCGKKSALIWDCRSRKK